MNKNAGNTFSRRSALASVAAALAFGDSAARRAVAAPANKLAPSTQATGLLSVRECYCPAHFGNSYEAMGPREMAAYLAEIKAFGFNRYGDWITTTDVCDPYASDATWDLAKEQLDRKKRAFRAAQDLGLKLNLIVTPNHVYLDQLRPAYAAEKGQRVFGQLVCPSHAEGRKVILNNFRRWFDDLADAGLRLDAFTAFAYDYGGCNCQRCRPWILTFARLMKEIHEQARRRHPDIQPWFCSWWWTPQEHEQFNDWATREAPAWLRGMTMHIEYGQTRPKDIAVPAGCRKLAFVHIGYGDQRGCEVYGRQGAVAAPRRIEQTVANLRGLGFEGFQAYSEGVFDDVNKALLGGLGSGRFAGPDAVLGDYARCYFGADEQKAARWAAWLAAWGDHGKVVFPAAAEELARLGEGVQADWRLEHWRVRLELERLDRLIGKPGPKDWTSEKLALVDQWQAAQERLYRRVYRLGPVRHVLNPRFMPPPWHDSWRKARSAAAGEGKTLLPQQ